MRRGRALIVAGTLVLAACVFALTASAGPKDGNNGNDNGDGHGGRGARSATPVFVIKLSPRQEVPPISGLRARGRGLVSFDLTRDASGVITAGEAIFYVNYDFPGPVTITGLHVHSGARGANGLIVIDSGIASTVDADGNGNVTAVVANVAPATLQAILDNPRGYYVNLHTSDHPDGAMRDQLRRPRSGLGGFGRP